MRNDRPRQILIGTLLIVPCILLTACGSTPSTGLGASAGSTPTTSIAVSPTNAANGAEAFTIEGQDAINALSCLAGGDCWATAGDDTIEHEHSGRWTAVPSPAADSLYGIDCLSANDCWAVGATKGNTPSNQIEHYDGSTWTTVSAPNDTSYPENGLDALACASAVGLLGRGVIRRPGRQRLICHSDSPPL